MTNLSYQNNDTEIVCYIGKNEFKPNGLCASENNTVEIEINDESEKDREYLENLYKNHYVEYNLNGDINITTYICPNGYKCNAEEITAYMLKENQDAVECLVCMPGCDEASEDNKSIASAIIDFVNDTRAKHPDECNSVMLVEDRRLDSAAQWKAQDFVDNNYFGYTDHLGRDSGTMINDFGVVWSQQGENLASIEISNEDEPTTENIIEYIKNEWMNNVGARNNIMSNDFNSIGIGVVKKETVSEDKNIINIYVVAEFAQVTDTQNAQIPKPTFNCDGKCVKKIKWWQEYDEVDIWEGLQSTTKRVPKPYIDMAIEIPKGLICAIEKVELKFEISPCRAYLEARKEPQPIPKDNEIKYTIEDGMIDDVWTVRWHLTNLSCLVPGEWIAAYAYLKGYDGCNPLLIGWNWFETQCWTSAIVQGCGLIDENGNIMEGGYLEDFNDDWAGDEKLHWLVYFKGSLFWIKSSDFARYSIGDRVFIQKGGLSQYRDSQNNLEQEPACRWPVGIGDVGKDVILDDSNVDYLIDKEKDIIIPQHFFGIGG